VPVSPEGAEMPSADGDAQGASVPEPFGGWVPDDRAGGGVDDRRLSDADVEDSDADDSDVDDSDVDDSDVEQSSADDLDASRVRVRAKRLGNRPWGRLAELWVPESLREARIDPGRRGLLVLLLVAALAAVATAVGVWRDRPEPRPVETVALAPASGVTGADAPVTAPISTGSAEVQPPSATGAATSPPATQIVVSVTGLVAHPGVVTLAVGARVTDAIAAAGGSTADADLTGLNLAAKLADGDSVVIAAAAVGGSSSGVSNAGAPGSDAPRGPGSPAGQRTASSLIDLNTADEPALDSLPGVGPVMAQNILAWREQNGRFTSIEQLQEISGIGPARYAQLAALVTVS